MLRGAAERTHADGMVPIEARCRWHLAEALVATGDHAAADRERATAEALAESCGMLLPPSRPARRPTTRTAPATRTAPVPASPRWTDAGEPPAASLRRTGRTWRIDVPQGTADVPHSIGLEQLSRILAAVPNDVEALELAGGDGAAVVERDLGPALDATAKRETGGAWPSCRPRWTRPTTTTTRSGRPGRGWRSRRSWASSAAASAWVDAIARRRRR